MTLLDSRKTKRDGTSEIVVSGYRIYFSGDCSGVEGRKGQHWVGLPLKQVIVKTAGKDGIAIETTAHVFLKARISTKSNLVTFVVAYAPTEEAPEGQKAKYMAALNSINGRSAIRLLFYRRERLDREER